MKKKIKLYLEITLGVILISIAFHFFFLPSGLVTGGVMGISIMLEKNLGVEPSTFLFAANGTLLLVGFIFLGKEFFVKTIYASLLTPTIVWLLSNVDPEWLMQHQDNDTSRFLVAAVVGSLVTATGLGLCFKNDATTGGMDVIQKIMVKYAKIPYSKTMYFTDFLVIIAGGFMFSPFGFDAERIVFGFIAVVVVGYVVDYIALNAKPRRTAYIITTKPEEMKRLIYKTIGRGVTLVDVKGGFTLEEKSMMICTLEKAEWYKVSPLLPQADERVFAFISTTKEVGGFYDKTRKQNRKEFIEDSK